MLTKEYQSALCLLDNLEQSTAEEFPHFAVSLVLYHCRHINKKLFVDLVSRFIDCGFNPLRHTDKYEQILNANIYACLS